jgi:hypothetical protein
MVSVIWPRVRLVQTYNYRNLSGPIMEGGNDSEGQASGARFSRTVLARPLPALSVEGSGLALSVESLFSL